MRVSTLAPPPTISAGAACRHSDSNAALPGWCRSRWGTRTADFRYWGHRRAISSTCATATSNRCAWNKAASSRTCSTPLSAPRSRTGWATAWGSASPWPMAAAICIFPIMPTSRSGSRASWRAPERPWTAPCTSASKRCKPCLWIGLPAPPPPPTPGVHTGPDRVRSMNLQPKPVTAALVGLKNRAAVFSVQRQVNQFAAEPLMSILPGVALDELWDVIGTGEQALLLMSALVAAVSMAALVSVVLAGLNERRRELAVLRAVGASPHHVLLLLALEGSMVTISGIAVGIVAMV